MRALAINANAFEDSELTAHKSFLTTGDTA
jgi:hypothetical protein